MKLQEQRRKQEIAINYHERLRDQLQALVRSATEQELDNAMQLLAELAKEVQP